jgi:hypothetical protein
MSGQELAKLEGLAIGLDQRGEKSAAQQVRWACTEVERLQRELDERTAAANVRMYELRAENERLLARCSEQRTKIDVLQVERMQVDAKLTEAAAFLDGLAETLDDMIGQGRRTPAGDDCRAMAAKLRGSTYDAEMERQHGPDLIRER